MPNLFTENHAHCNWALLSADKPELVGEVNGFNFYHRPVKNRPGTTEPKEHILMASKETLGYGMPLIVHNPFNGECVNTNFYELPAPELLFSLGWKTAQEWADNANN